MAIDREATIRQAEKLQRQGRIDLAIAEYVRLVDEQPRDFNSMNALGDLYLRSGDVERAVVQFVQIADHLFSEGFFPKAAALYKKALKSKPDHEHTLLRLAEIAAAQELLADARTYLRKLWELRGERGDDRGAADCLVRLATLPEADSETVLTGARASKALGDSQQAIALFRTAAEQLQKAGRSAAALDALTQVAEIDPEASRSDPDLLLALALAEIKRNDDDAARVALTRFIALAPDRSTDVLRLAGELGRGGEPDRAFICGEVVVDDAVLRSDWDTAVDVLQSFLVHGSHIPALVKLVQVARDAGLDDVLQETQERLADAYIENGDGAEAQQLAQELFTRAPDSPVHAARLRRAMELAGADDPDQAVASIRQRLDSASSPVTLPVEEIDPLPALDDPPALDLPALEDLPMMEVAADIADDLPMSEPAEDVTDVDVVIEVAPAAGVSQVEERPADPVEIDLSETVGMLGLAPSKSAAAPGAPAESKPSASADLDSVFDAHRPRAADYRSVADAAELYERGRQRLENGEVSQGLEDLEEAARVPALRFPAAARLGREYVTRGHAHAGIEWLERAAEMAPPSRDAGLAVLYELGVALERVGESARALAVLMEIATDEPDYRDVRQRLDVLVRAENERRR